MSVYKLIFLSYSLSLKYITKKMKQKNSYNKEEPVTSSCNTEGQMRDSRNKDFNCRCIPHQKLQSIFPVMKQKLINYNYAIGNPHINIFKQT